MAATTKMDVSRDQETFASLLLSLQGVTVLAEPRVSRETILSVLRDHTIMMKAARSELSSVSSIVNMLATEAADNRRVLQNLKDDCQANKKEIDQLFRAQDSFRLEMDEVGLKIAELFQLREVVTQQGEDIVALNSNLSYYKEEMATKLKDTTDLVDLLDTKNSETQFQLKELRHYVDHFGDNLILASNQITVEASAGFSTRPLSLLEVLKKTNGTIHEIEHNLDTQGKQISENTNDIASKADDTILFNVDTLESKVRAIEAHLKREEEQGISAIRKQTEHLTEAVDQIQFQLQDKVGQEAVDNIVHTKYEDIVAYLKDALSSSAEDENNFKQKADELQTMMTKIVSTKADRTELSAIEEVAVRAESMLSKLSSDKRGSKDTYTKKELESFLELKVDKLDFEQQISVMLKGKKSLKSKLSLANISSSQIVMDESIGSPVSTPYASNREAAMWKGLADVMKAESDTAMTNAMSASRALPITGKQSTNDFGNYMKTRQVVPSIKEKGNTTSMPRGNGSPIRLERSESPQMRTEVELLSLGGGSALSSILQKNLQGYPHVPPGSSNMMDDAIPDHDVSYIGGAHAGAGFNFKGSTTKFHQGLQPMGKESAGIDVEGSGLMVKGKDGKFYYQEIDDEAYIKIMSSSNPSLPVTTTTGKSKPLNMH